MKSEDYRREYNLMVDEIHRQLQELKKADPDSVSLDRYRRRFQKVTTRNPHFRTIQSQYMKAKKLLASNELSLESQKRSKAAAIRTLHKEGLTFINRKNFNSFMRFLDDARARGLGSIYSSTQILEPLIDMQKKGMTKEQIKNNIKYWADEYVKYDENGKIIEVIEPKKLEIKL